MSHTDVVYQAIKEINASCQDGNIRYAERGEILQKTGLSEDEVDKALEQLHQLEQIKVLNPLYGTGLANRDKIIGFSKIMAC